MIGSFWNLCRACPSMPVDKLHSEYRSTYRWHEFKQQQEQGVVKQPAPAPPTALNITRGPIEPAMPRRKKYPGMAYKTNELFEPAPNAEIRPQTGTDRARSAQRNDTERAGRRSKSEGPRQPRWTDTVEPKATTALGEVLAVKEPDVVSTEYQNQFAWPKDETTPRKSISMGALKKAAVAEGSVEAVPLMNHVDGDDDHQQRYVEDYLWNGQKPGVQRGKGKSHEEASERMLGEPQAGTAGEDRRAGSGTGKSGVGENSAQTLRAAGLQPLGLAQGDSWYREVLDLRKRAGEYKYRGWGTELAPEHITQLYNKQIELWYQVSRRSSLSALSLASTNHKALPRDEKDGKESRNHSPKKFRSFRSAPHQSIHAKLQETKAQEKSPSKTSPQKQRKKLQGQSFDEGAIQDGAKTGESREFRSPRRRPRSADPAPAPLRAAPAHDARPSKPTDNEIPSHRSASVAKDHFFDDSPVVKSPPEPTRVKSPEQMNMRSPDPVNWTVPLDTGKTFTVTQNVKNEIAPIHHQQMSPIRSLKKSESPTSLSKRTDKTPTTPISLTPIDETKALDINGANVNGVNVNGVNMNGVNVNEINVNGVNGINGISSNQLTPESPEELMKEKEVFKKSTEATQIAPGVVDTTVVAETPTGGLTAAEVLDRARTRFDKFWGKKEEDNV